MGYKERSCWERLCHPRASNQEPRRKRGTISHGRALVDVNIWDIMTTYIGNVREWRKSSGKKMYSWDRGRNRKTTGRQEWDGQWERRKQWNMTITSYHGCERLRCVYGRKDTTTTIGGRERRSSEKERRRGQIMKQKPGYCARHKQEKIVTGKEGRPKRKGKKNKNADMEM